MITKKKQMPNKIFIVNKLKGQTQLQLCSQKHVYVVGTKDRDMKIDFNIIAKMEDF